MQHNYLVPVSCNIYHIPTCKKTNCYSFKHRHNPFFNSKLFIFGSNISIVFIMNIGDPVIIFCMHANCVTYSLINNQYLILNPITGNKSYQSGTKYLCYKGIVSSKHAAEFYFGLVDKSKVVIVKNIQITYVLFY